MFTVFHDVASAHEKFLNAIRRIYLLKSTRLKNADIDKLVTVALRQERMFQVAGPTFQGYYEKEGAIGSVA